MNKCNQCLHYSLCLQMQEIKDTTSAFNCAFYKDKSHYIKIPCTVGDSVKIKALCECLNRTPIHSECRYLCPYEDSCEFDECSTNNERIFTTKISGIYNNGYGWKFSFENFVDIEGTPDDIGKRIFLLDDSDIEEPDLEVDEVYTPDMFLEETKYDESEFSSDSQDSFFVEDNLDECYIDF